MNGRLVNFKEVILMLMLVLGGNSQISLGWDTSSGPEITSNIGKPSQHNRGINNYPVGNENVYGGMPPLQPVIQAMPQPGLFGNNGGPSIGLPPRPARGPDNSYLMQNM